MKAPSYPDVYEVLCLQAADNGRGNILFGDSLARARREIRPFIGGEEFPNVYFEFPLIGSPFLDITVLYGNNKLPNSIESDAVGDVGALLAWFEGAARKHPDISFGFELDTEKPELPPAGIHFQPRVHNELVVPFCEIIGEPERGALYLELCERMPEGWPLSFFGMFRGRSNAPLRICGYLSSAEIVACAEDPSHLKGVFDAIGFTAYDQAMLEQASRLLQIAPGDVDFQFDVHPDGTLGDTFAFDIQFEIEQPRAVVDSFTSGRAFPVMDQFERWGIADGRWKHGAEAAFARAIPVELDDGSIDKFSFTLMPQWAKARWRNCELLPAKLYSLGSAGFIHDRQA